MMRNEKKMKKVPFESKETRFAPIVKEGRVFMLDEKELPPGKNIYNL